MNDHHIVKQYELLNSSPERVYEVYKNITKDEVHRLVGMGDTERELLNKNEPLINLALAKFSIDKNTLPLVFKKAIEENNLALKIACLSYNPRDKGNDWHNIGFNDAQPPVGLFYNYFDKDTIKKNIIKWMQTADYWEITALFSNENIDRNFLCDFLTGGEYWNSIQNSIKESVIEYLASYNTQIFNHDWLTPKKKDVLDALWNLAGLVETTTEWARILADLYSKMSYIPSSIEESTIKRWFIDGEENGVNSLGLLSTTSELRFCLYKTYFRSYFLTLHLAQKEKNPNFNLEHPDIAYRAAQYNYLKINPDQIEAAHRKDHYTAYMYLVKNKGLWENKCTRDAIIKIGEGTDYELDYIEFELDYKKSNPEWFKD